MTTSVVATTRVSTPTRGGLRYIPTVAFGADLALITFSVFAAILGRETIQFPGALPNVDLALDFAGPVMIISWVVAIFLFGGYRSQVFGAGLDEYKRIGNASLVTAAVVGIGCYLLQFQLSRGFFVLAFLIGIPVLVLGRYLLRRSLQRARTLGSLQVRVVIAGAEGHVDEIASVLRREKWLGYNVVGALTPEPGDREATHSGIPLLGSSRSIAEVAIDAKADVVFLAGGAFSSSTEMRHLAWDLEHEDIAVVIAPSVTDVSSERVSVRPVGGLPLIHLEKPRSADAARRAKRTFDIVGSLGLMLMFMPVFLFGAFRVWKHDRGPILFRQTRVGRDGTTFRCWKFRTMVTNAEELLPSLQTKAGYEGGLFKLEDDPRITPSRQVDASVLRRRAAPALQRAQGRHEPGRPASAAGARGGAVRRRHGSPSPRPSGHDRPLAGLRPLRPGWSEAIRLDLYYVDNWSMFQDLNILTRTFGAVFNSRGAY